MKRFKPVQVPHLHGEEIGRDDLIPMSTKKLFPGRFLISLGRRFNAVTLQNIRDSRARNAMSQVSQGTLKSAVTPTAILCGHSNNEVRNLRRS